MCTSHVPCCIHSIVCLCITNASRLQTEEELEAALGEAKRHRGAAADKQDESASGRDAADEHEEQRRAVV
jgi:hypothetical protein